MKRLRLWLALGLLTASATAVSGGASGSDSAPPHILPVLVQVDSAGKVTDMSPSVRLSPKFDRMLRDSLDRMISKPATDHGRPISSQFVVNLAVDVVPRDDGDFDARFAYVSAKPVPSGHWYWYHREGQRLALANRDMEDMRRAIDLNPRRGISPIQPQGNPNTTGPSQPSPTASRSGGSFATNR